MWDLVPWPGIKPRPLYWERGASATRPPGSPSWCAFWIFIGWWLYRLDHTDLLLLMSEKGYSFIWAEMQEKAMAPQSSTLAWKIPWREEPGGLQSMGSLRVGHDWASSLSLFTFIHWRRKWQPTPVFLPGESQGQGSLVGCHLWACTESDTTEAT